MLEVKSYLLSDLKVYLHTSNKQNTDNKLKRYGVKYTLPSKTARSRNPIYEITEITNPFKLYCVFDLGLPPQTDFTKFRDFLFYLFGDPDFSWRPAEMMEAYLDETHHSISRQTISNYIKQLERLGYVAKAGDMVYYRVYREYPDYYSQDYIQKHDIVSREEYSAAWGIYWHYRRLGADSLAAFSIMYRRFGGAPRKQERVEQNALYTNELDYLNKLVCESFLAEYGGQE